MFLDKPVTVDRVVAAYQAVDYTPLQSDFIRDDGCCGISALGMAEAGVHPDEIRDYQDLDGDVYLSMSRRLDLEIDEVYGFAYGFDGLSESALLAACERETLGVEMALAAYALGQEAWARLQS